MKSCDENAVGKPTTNELHFNHELLTTCRASVKDHYHSQTKATIIILVPRDTEHIVRNQLWKDLGGKSILFTMSVTVAADMRR